MSEETDTGGAPDREDPKPTQEPQGGEAAPAHEEDHRNGDA